MRRLEVETRANFERWSVSLLYGNYDKQPELGFLNRREGVLGTASVKVATNWVVSGGIRYDLHADKVNQTIVGAGYVDDCFVLAMNYITDYSYSGNPVTNHRVMLQIGLRTIGTTSFNQSTAPSSSGSSTGSSLFGL
jgi:LPS-assembly protein